MIRPAGALLVATALVAGCSPDAVQPPLSNRLAGRRAPVAVKFDRVAATNGRHRV